MKRNGYTDNTSDLYSGFSCFDSLCHDERIKLNDNKSIVTYSKGETICKEGGLSSGVKFICEGLVKVFLEGPRNRNIIVKIVNSGDFIGLSTLYGNNCFSYSATALRTSRVLTMNRESVLDLIRTNSDFAIEITKWYCMSYDKVYKKLESFGFKNLPGRMAYVLLYLKQDKYLKQDVYMDLSRKDLAELAGVPMESAVRILSDFVKSKLIELRGRNIEIIDLPRLEAISRGG